MFGLPLELFPIPKTSRSAPSDPSPIEQEDDGARPEVGWVPLEMGVRPIPLPLGKSARLFTGRVWIWDDWG